VVKGVRFNDLQDKGDAVDLGEAYADSGADELVFLDITATLEKRAAVTKLIESVADRVSIPFTVGGGIADARDALALVEAGADKVAVNSAALARPSLMTQIADVLGSQAVVCAIDTAGRKVFSHAGRRDTGREVVAWAREAENAGAGEILLTSISSDGTQKGYDVETTAAVAAAVSIPVIASGGAGTARDIAAALQVAQAALLASILHDDPTRLPRLRDELIEMGVSLRDAG
jgi:cyclase